MPIEFQTVLNEVCSGVQLFNENNTQHIYLLSDDKEAKLAADLLLAHGFDCKIYSENDQNKLYITLPPADATWVMPSLTAAAAYARALGPLKRGMDAMVFENAESLKLLDYMVTFANNTATGGKQIVIQMNPITPAFTPSSPQNAIIKQSNTTQTYSHKQHAKKAKKVDPDEGFASGPSVARTLFTTEAKQASTQPDSWQKQLWLYLTGHVFTGLSIALALALFAFVVFNLGTLSKAFLCPDLATVKSKAWYCK